MIADAISNFFNKLMFGILKMLATIIDTIINIMRKLLGLDGASGGSSNLLLDALTNEAVIGAFITIIALGFIAMFIFAIIRILRNFFNDEKDDGAVSKNKAVKEILHAVINMVALPAFCIALILAVTATAKVIDSATRNSFNSDYGTKILFSTVTEDNLNTEGKEWFTGADENHKIFVIKATFKEDVLKNNNGELPSAVPAEYLEQVTGMDAVKYYWTGEDFYNEIGNKRPNNCNQSFSSFKKLVNDDYYFSNFLLPLLGGCIMVCSLGMSVVVVGQRLFYCVFLFIISPFIVSTRPMDDGARWKKWCEIFLSKLIGAFAIIICLNVFFLLSAELVKLQFFPAEKKLANSITKIIIYIAGVIAATGASQLVAQLIGADAGQSERDQTQNTFRSLATGGAVAGSLTRGAGKLAGGVGNFFGGKKQTPLSNALGAGAGSATASNASALAGESMASKIGNTLMGKNTAGEVAKAMGKGVANSRIGNVGKGIGTFVAGVGVGAYKMVAYVPKKVTGGIQRAYAKKHPDSKTAEKLSNADRRSARMKNISSKTTPQQRERLFKVARNLNKKSDK